MIVLTSAISFASVAANLSRHQAPRLYKRRVMTGFRYAPDDIQDQPNEYNTVQILAVLAFRRNWSMTLQ
jgi:hypothetical protein